MNEAVDTRAKNFLNEGEAAAFLAAAKLGRHGVRDYAMALMAYRHGMRVSELIGMQMSDLDLDAQRLFVRRSKGSLSTTQPIANDEARALKAWLRLRVKSIYSIFPVVFLSERGRFTRQAINYLFREIGLRAKLSVHVHPHMLRHSCGYALANKGRDSRLIQDYLGHKDLRYTQLYTRTASVRFEKLWE